MYNLETNIRCPGGCGLRKYESISTLDSLIGMVYYLALKNASIFAFLCLNFDILSNILSLEPICCKKQQKKVPDQLLVCEIGDL